MIRISLVFRAMGERFSPGVAEVQTGILFSKKNERGDIGDCGRYKGQPIPYGSGDLREPSDNSDLVIPSDAFFKALNILVPVCRKAMADSMLLHIDVAFEDQCNMELSEHFLRAVSKLGIPVTVSCFGEKP